MKLESAWTDERIEKLRQYVEASRCFRVENVDGQVGEVLPRSPEHGEAGWAAFTFKGDDEPYPLEDYKLEDFRIIPLAKMQNWWERDVQADIDFYLKDCD